jgi:GNAT superfamily N-acetyltransferase
MNINIGRLSSAECGRASRLLTRAFADDPIITHFLYDHLRRWIAFPAFFRAVIEEMLPSSHVYAAHNDDNLIGVAAWLPPNAPEPDAAARRAAARQQRVVRMMFPRSSRSLFQGFVVLGEFHPSDPHWYLAFVGIEPTMQSRGIGHTLLAPVLNLADQTNALCYLETPFPRTHQFYERLGFVRHAEHKPFIGAPKGVVTFLRQPSPAAQERSDESVLPEPRTVQPK